MFVGIPRGVRKFGNVWASKYCFSVLEKGSKQLTFSNVPFLLKHKEPNKIVFWTTSYRSVERLSAFYTSDAINTRHFILLLCMYGYGSDIGTNEVFSHCLFIGSCAMNDCIEFYMYWNLHNSDVLVVNISPGLPVMFLYRNQAADLFPN